MINVIKSIWQYDPEQWKRHLHVILGIIIVLTAYYSLLFIISIIVESAMK